MNISPDLRDKLISEYEKYRPSLERAVLNGKFTCAFVKYPIMLLGVMDFVRYSVEERRFDQLEVWVATEDIVASDMLPDGSVFCGKSKIVEIPLP